MSTHTLVIAALIASCGRSPPRCDAAPVTPFARALATCKQMIRPPGDMQAANPDVDQELTVARDHDATIRVLSTEPFRFQDRREISTAAVPPELVSKLAALPFGAVVKAHLREPPVMNSNPPPDLTGIEPGAVPAAESALLAEWRPAGFQTRVQVYADGHALVTAPPDHFIDATLAQSEFDSFLDSFARAGFDALPEDPHPVDDYGDRVVLLCQRYQQVDAHAHAHARELAPVVSAFERIRDQALARARPILRVTNTGWHPKIFAWPADAPPLTDDWYSAKFLAATGDGSSPMYRKLPEDLAAALATATGARRVIVRDHGQLWGLAVEHCDSCRPWTYSMIVLEKEPWDDAPDWAPDFARIGDKGLFLDGQDPRYRTLGTRGYHQHGDIYRVQQAEAIPKT